MVQEYSLDDLFRTTGKIDVRLPGGKSRTFYLRTLNATEDYTRRQHALKEARTQRNRLKTPESVDYQLEIEPIYEADREMLEKTLQDIRRMELLSEALRMVEQESYPEPSDEADLTELMEVEDEKEAIEQEVSDARAKYVVEHLAAFETEIAGLDMEELRKRSAQYVIERLCEQRYNIAYWDATLAFAVYTDAKRTKRFVADPKTASQIEPSVYEQLRAEYDQMDRWGKGDALKN